MLTRSVRIGCAAGLAALALAACNAGSEASEEASAAEEDPLAAYTACLEEQGIELPEDWSPFGGGGMPGGERPTDGEMPTGDMSGDGEAPTDMPSGGPGGGFAAEAPEGVDADDWTAATEACAGELPELGSGGGQEPGTEESSAA